MRTYMVVDFNGNALTTGLQGPEVCDEAEIAALRCARSRREPVWLVSEDAPGEDLDSEGLRVDPVTVTDEQIEQLRAESAQAGDLVQVALCDRALNDDIRARARCQHAIENARAQR